MFQHDLALGAEAKADRQPLVMFSKPMGMKSQLRLSR